MWKELPKDQIECYKRMILAFSSLSEMFAQKAESDSEQDDESDVKLLVSPIVNSKYQETVFQKSFHAKAEDIGNTSYDASIFLNSLTQNKKIYVGIKTFGINSGDQKIAQFKGDSPSWTMLIEEMGKNAKDLKTKEEIDKANEGLYYELALHLAKMRNDRIQSSEADIKGFGEDELDIERVYHVLMPSKRGEDPKIFVGETSYTKIDISRIKVIGKDIKGATLGCTSVKKPQNFKFSDGIHVYKFTPADSQLYMAFNNSEIIVDTWDVVFDKNACDVFLSQADKLFGKTNSYQTEQYFKSSKSNADIDDFEEITESYSWLIENSRGQVERSSGFNNFYGTSSKNPKSRSEKFASLITKYSKYPEYSNVLSLLNIFVNGDSKLHDMFQIRDEILREVKVINSKEFENEVNLLVFRLLNEIYIPLPKASEFHSSHPDFFGKGIGKIIIEESNRKSYGDKVNLSKEEKQNLKLRKSFDLVFEPSGKIMKCHITQDCGKGIQSVEHQAILGNWILSGIFQLEKFEPLTVEKMNEIGKNGIRIYRTNKDDSPHLQFIWIDKDNLPNDFIDKSK